MKRVSVSKTFKMYENGAFIRSESGRTIKIETDKGFLANVPRASRKDLRNGVSVARKAQPFWAARSAYNRGQIVYRIAEMLETSIPHFIKVLKSVGYSEKKAISHLETAIDRCVHYAGWTDKYQQVFGSINPVASAHFNFSLPEPTGMAVGFLNPNQGILGVLNMMLPAIAGGNTIIIVIGDGVRIPELELAEIIHRSDVPNGVVNIYSGLEDELLSVAASHMDVNALIIPESISPTDKEKSQKLCADNMKRLILWPNENPSDDSWNDPYLIQNLQEIKTTWHPVGL